MLPKYEPGPALGLFLFCSTIAWNSGYNLLICCFIEMETLMLFSNEAWEVFTSDQGWVGFGINDMLPLESQRCLRDWMLLAWECLLSSAHRSKMQECMRNAGLSHYFSLFPLCTIDTCTMTGRFLSAIRWALDLHQFTPVMSVGERRHSKFGTLSFSHDCYVVKHLIACYRMCILSCACLHLCFSSIYVFPAPLA